MREFYKKYPGGGYTINQVSNMIANAGITDQEYNQQNILKFVKAKGISIDLVKEGLAKDKKGHIRYIIPTSRLVNLIEGMSIPVSVEQLELTAARLGF